jgi:ATP-dependent protease HslVU (ClpYQ), ATPase subunit
VVSCPCFKPGIIFPYFKSREIALVASLVKLLQLTYESELQEKFPLTPMPASDFLTTLTEPRLNLVTAQYSALILN